MQSAGQHVLGEGARGQRLVELRTEREDPGPMPTADDALRDEVVEGPAQRHPGDAELLRELALGRELLSGGHAVEAIEELIPNRVEFRHSPIESQLTHEIKTTGLLWGRGGARRR